MIVATLKPTAINLNSLIGSMFLLCSFGMLVTRQMQSLLRMYVIQSVLLASSALVFWYYTGTPDLLVFACITIVGKCIIVPLLMKRFITQDALRKREIDQAISIPLSLLLAIGLTLIACASMLRLIGTGLDTKENVNLAFGLAAFLIGLLTLIARKEALPQVISLLALENAVFLSGISIAPTLSIYVELGLTFDIMVLAVIVALLTQMMYANHGSTDIEDLEHLKKDVS